MSGVSVKVLVVDDNEKTRDGLIAQLRFEDIEVVGESTLGAAAFTWAGRLDVDIVIVAIEEPVARGLRTVESLTVGARTWPVLGFSSLGDRETMRKAMIAGVRDFVVAPTTGEELRRTILNVHQVDGARRAAVAQGGSATKLGTIVTIFGVKGGIGKSVVATNVAVALAQETKQHVAMLDLDLQFGDAAVMLDVVPAHTVEDAAKELERMDPQLITGYLTDHPSRLKLLAAPATPDGAEQISPEQVGQILETLASTHDYVVVDTGAQLDGVSTVAMDLATIVLLVVAPEVPCVRRTKAALTLMQGWGYSRDKVKLVVNRTRRRTEVSIAEIEQVLDYPIYAQIPDDRAVTKAISIGTPVAMSGPKTKSGRAILAMGRNLAGLPERHHRFAPFHRRSEPARPRETEGPRPVALPPGPPRPATPAVAARSALLSAWRDEPAPPDHGPSSDGERPATGDWNVSRDRDDWGTLVGLLGLNEAASAPETRRNDAPSSDGRAPGEGDAATAAPSGIDATGYQTHEAVRVPRRLGESTRPSMPSPSRDEFPLVASSNGATS